MIIQVDLPLTIKDINKYKHLPFIRRDHNNEGYSEKNKTDIESSSLISFVVL